MNEDWRTITNPATGEEVTFVETSQETGGLRVVMRLTLAPGGAVQAHSHRLAESFECVEGQSTSAWMGRHAGSNRARAPACLRGAFIRSVTKPAPR